MENFFKFLTDMKLYFPSQEHFMTLDLKILIINIFIVFTIFVLYYDKKLRDLFKDRELLILLCINIILVIIVHIFISEIIIFTPITIFFVLNFFMILKDKNIFYFFNKKEDSNNKSNKSGKSSDFVTNYRLKRLNKEKDFNILDILYLYDYITDYQRRKVIQNLITESVDKMAESLLSVPTITEDELNEARAILNIIELQNNLISKEEAILYLLENNIKIGGNKIKKRE